MIHAKKMMLVSPEDASRLRGEDVDTPTEPAGSLNALDTEMRRILESSGPSDQEKWTLYRQVLLTFMSKLRERKKTSPDDPDIVNDEHDEQPEYDLRAREKARRRESSAFDTYNTNLVESYDTERAKNKARVLINLLKRNQDITWDSSGDVSIGGTAVPATFTDLIRLALSGRKKDRPAGWGRFHDLLLRMNVPDAYLGRSVTRKSRLKTQKKRVNDVKAISKWKPY